MQRLVERKCTEELLIAGCYSCCAHPFRVHSTFVLVLFYAHIKFNIVIVLVLSFCMYRITFKASKYICRLKFSIHIGLTTLEYRLGLLAYALPSYLT